MSTHRVSVHECLADLSSPDPQRRRRGVVRLRRAGAAEAVHLLVSALCDADAGVRALACVGLGELQARGHPARLLPLLHYENWFVRAMAAEALRCQGGPQTARRPCRYCSAC